MSRLDTIFGAQLENLERRSGRRVLRPAQPMGAGRIRRDGHTLINFSSNDYLGLSRHPLLLERACEWTWRWGAGAGASRLVCGTLDLHKEVEAKIARLKGTACGRRKNGR